MEVLIWPFARVPFVMHGASVHVAVWWYIPTVEETGLCGMFLLKPVAIFKF